MARVVFGPGYELVETIIKNINVTCGDIIKVNAGVLYQCFPVRNKAEIQAFVRASWALFSSGRYTVPFVCPSLSSDR